MDVLGVLVLGIRMRRFQNIFTPNKIAVFLKNMNIKTCCVFFFYLDFYQTLLFPKEYEFPQYVSSSVPVFLL